MLANRASVGVVGGDNFAVGQSDHDHGFARKVGYAQQNDLHLSTSTVKEALTFSALLRQPPQYSRTEKLAYVKEVIRLLDMSSFKNAIIGVPGEGQALVLSID